MAILPCRLDDETGGSTHDAPGARHSGDSTVSGALIASTFSYLRDRTVHYTQASVDYADTIPARVAPLVWGGTPATSSVGTVNRTIDTYHIFSLPTQGGTGTLYICGQAQWQTIGDTYDVLGLEVLRQYEWTRYQWKPPLGCPFWTKSASDPIVRWVAGNGIGWAGDGGDPRAALIALPWAVAKGPDGAYYIGTAGSVRRVTCHQISTVAGTGTAGHSGDGSALSTPIGLARGIAFDAAGRMIIADYNSGGLLFPQNEFTAPSYRALKGATNGSTFSKLNNLPVFPPFGGFWLPAPTILAPYNTVRVVDLGLNTITTPPLTYQAPGFTQTDGANPINWLLDQANGLAIGPDGTLYVSVSLLWGQAQPGFDISLGSFTEFNATYFDAIFTVDPGLTTVTLLVWQGSTILDPGSPSVTISQIGYPIDGPGAPAVSAAGNLYWANSNYALTGDVSVQKRTPAGVFSQVGGSTFRGSAVAVDGAGNVYTADAQHHVIRRWDATTRITKIICGVLDSPGNTAPGSPGPLTHLNTPSSIHVTPEGIVTFGDLQNSRVLQIGGNS